MAEGRQRETWNHTSHLLAWIQNFAFRLKRDRNDVVSPRSLNPTLPKEKPLKLPAGVWVETLRDVFVPKPK